MASIAERDAFDVVGADVLDLSTVPHRHRSIVAALGYDTIQGVVREVPVDTDRVGSRRLLGAATGRRRSRLVRHPAKRLRQPDGASAHGDAVGS